jgi:hypothetical protein
MKIRPREGRQSNETGYQQRPQDSVQGIPPEKRRSDAALIKSHRLENDNLRVINAELQERIVALEAQLKVGAATPAIAELRRDLLAAQQRAEVAEDQVKLLTQQLAAKTLAAEEVARRDKTEAARLTKELMNCQAGKPAAAQPQTIPPPAVPAQPQQDPNAGIGPLYRPLKVQTPILGGQDVRHLLAFLHFGGYFKIPVEPWPRVFNSAASAALKEFETDNKVKHPTVFTVDGALDVKEIIYLNNLYQNPKYRDMFITGPVWTQK